MSGMPAGPSDDAPSIALTGVDGTPLAVPDLLKDQPFVITVRRPWNKHDTVGQVITVTVHTDHGDRTVTLKDNGAVKGLVTWVSRPLTLSGGGEGADALPIGPFEVSWGDLGKVNVDNGGTVTFSNGDGAAQVTTKVTAYDSARKQVIGRADVFMDVAGRALREFLHRLADAPDEPAVVAARKEASEKLAWVEAYEKMRVRADLSDVERAALGDAYTTIVRHLGRTPDPIGLVADEMDRARRGIRSGYQSAIDVFMKDFAIALYQLTMSQVPLTGSLWTLITGSDIMGNKLRGWEFVAVAADAVSQVALLGASMKFNLDHAVPGTTRRIDRPYKTKPPEGVDITKGPADVLVQNPEDFGMLKPQAKKIQAVIDQKAGEWGVRPQVAIRPTTRDAVGHLAEGLVGKPEPLKPKTINETDFKGKWAQRVNAAGEYTGGTVGYFTPERISEAVGVPGDRIAVKVPDPANPGGDPIWKNGECPEGVDPKVWDRAVQRFREYFDEKAMMDKVLARGLATVNEAGQIIDHGIAGYGLDPVTHELVPRGYGTKGGTGRPMTGDPDLWSITDSEGRPLPLNLQKELEAALGDAGVMHGAITMWDPHEPKNIAIKSKILQQHLGQREGSTGLVVAKDGAEALIIFRGRSEPLLTGYANRPVQGRFAFRNRAAGATAADTGVGHVAIPAVVIPHGQRVPTFVFNPVGEGTFVLVGVGEQTIEWVNGEAVVTGTPPAGPDVEPGDALDGILKAARAAFGPPPAEGAPPATASPPVAKAVTSGGIATPARSPDVAPTPHAKDAEQREVIDRQVAELEQVIPKMEEWLRQLDQHVTSLLSVLTQLQPMAGGATGPQIAVEIQRVQLMIELTRQEAVKGHGELIDLRIRLHELKAAQPKAPPAPAPAPPAAAPAPPAAAPAPAAPAAPAPTPQQKRSAEIQEAAEDVRYWQDKVHDKTVELTEWQARRTAGDDVRDQITATEAELKDARDTLTARKHELERLTAAPPPSGTPTASPAPPATPPPSTPAPTPVPAQPATPTTPAASPPPPVTVTRHLRAMSAAEWAELADAEIALAVAEQALADLVAHGAGLDDIEDAQLRRNAAERRRDEVVGRLSAPPPPPPAPDPAAGVEHAGGGPSLVSYAPAGSPAEQAEHGRGLDPDAERAARITALARSLGLAPPTPPPPPQAVDPVAGVARAGGGPSLVSEAPGESAAERAARAQGLNPDAVRAARIAELGRQLGFTPPADPAAGVEHAGGGPSLVEYAPGHSPAERAHLDGPAGSGPPVSFRGAAARRRAARLRAAVSVAAIVTGAVIGLGIAPRAHAATSAAAGGGPVPTVLPPGGGPTPGGPTPSTSPGPGATAPGGGVAPPASTPAAPSVVLVRLTANLVPPATTYTIDVSNPANVALTYDWTTTTIGCGRFDPTTGPTAVWEHGNDPFDRRPPPPPYCEHFAGTSHPGTVRVVVRGPGGLEATCSYAGSESGKTEPCGPLQTVTPPTEVTVTAPPTTLPRAASIGTGVFVAGDQQSAGGDSTKALKVTSGLLLVAVGLGGLLVPPRRRANTCDCEQLAADIADARDNVAYWEAELAKATAARDAAQEGFTSALMALKLDSGTMAAAAAEVAKLEAAIDALRKYIDMADKLSTLLGSDPRKLSNTARPGWVRVADHLWAADAATAAGVRAATSAAQALGTVDLVQVSLNIAAANTSLINCLEALDTANNTLDMERQQCQADLDRMDADKALLDEAQARIGECTSVLAERQATLAGLVAALDACQAAGLCLPEHG